MKLSNEAPTAQTYVIGQHERALFSLKLIANQILNEFSGKILASDYETICKFLSELKNCGLVSNDDFQKHFQRLKRSKDIKELYRRNYEISKVASDILDKFNPKIINFDAFDIEKFIIALFKAKIILDKDQALKLIEKLKVLGLQINQTMI